MRSLNEFLRSGTKEPKNKELILTEENSDLKDKISFLIDMLKRYDHYVATTNFKVGLMMSFLGAIVLGLTIRIILLEPLQGELSCIRCAAILFSVTTIISSLFTTIQLLRVVFPDTENIDGFGSVVFFGSVAFENKNANEYYEKIECIERGVILKDLAIQTYSMARIVSKKFKILKFAVNTMIYITVPLLAASLILLIAEGL